MTDKKKQVTHIFDGDTNKIVEMEITEKQLAEKKRREEIIADFERDYKWLKGLSND